MPSFFVLLCLIALVSPACQTKGGTGGYDTDPGQTNPDTSTTNGNKKDPIAVQPNTTTTGPNDAGTSVTSPRFIGRVVSGGNLLTWPGTAVEAGFTGTSGTATFKNASGTNYIGVTVDGGNQTTVVVNAASVSVPFRAASQGSHIVRFTKLNEAELGTVAFLGMTVTDGKTVPYTATTRRIEMIGDSITVGYGVLGTAPCVNTSATEDNTKAWGWVAGQTLNADVSNIAWSGRGLYRNGVNVDSTDLMPAMWQQTQAIDSTATYDFSKAQAPQAVVINLGTNDYTYIGYRNGSQYNARGSLSQSAFTSAYVDFVRQIRTAYPNALIVLATSPMLSDDYPSKSDKQWTALQTATQSVVSQLADPNVTTLAIPTQDTNTTGCDGHPSATVQQSMGALLVTLLQQKLNWQ